MQSGKPWGRIVGLSAGILVATVALVVFAQGPGSGPGSQGSMMGPGMMGHGMMGGSAMGPGMMMGGGPMGPMMMGPGMAGSGMMMGGGAMGPAAMGPGMMGSGPMMMGGCPGMMGTGIPAQAAMTVPQVKAALEQYLAAMGNPRLKVGKVDQTSESTITAEIVTVDNSLVQKLAIDRNNRTIQQVQ